MRRFKLKIGVDVDDILFSCNEYAVERSNRKHKLDPPLTINEVVSWGRTGRRQDVVLEQYEEEDFFQTQPVIEGAKDFIHRLNSMAEVFLVTAVKPKFMGIRASRLLEEFPEIPEENIIMGSRKDLISMDMILDDGAHNILQSNSTYPVLMRKPWNQHMTGCLAVNNYEDFLTLVETILSSRKEPEEGGNKIFVLIGPSGSGKTAILRPHLTAETVKRVPSYTTRPKREGEEHGKDYYFVDKDTFLKLESAGAFFETTRYAGACYGSRIGGYESALEKGHVAAVMDVCGAIAVKKAFPDRTVLIFVDRPKEKILETIMDRDCGNDEKVRRIISLSDELKNESICDEVIRNDSDLASAVSQLAELILKYS